MRYRSIAQGLAIEALLNGRPAQRSTSMSRPFVVYSNPDTSETSGEFTTLQHALLTPPQTGAQIVQNGTVMATVERSAIWDCILWNLTPAGRAARSKTHPMPSRHYNSDPHWKGRSYKKGGQRISVLRERVRERREQEAQRRAILSPQGKLARIKAIWEEWNQHPGDGDEPMHWVGLVLQEPDPRCPSEQIRKDARRHWMVKDGAESPAADELQRMLEEAWLAGFHSK